MRSILSGARGMSPVVLVILIAWALLAVIFLTGTLLAARSIDRSVSGVTNRTDDQGKPEKNIQDTVTDIGAEAKFIDEARKTVGIATAIRKAADPLSGRLARTLEVADKGIDPKLKSILGKVGTINASAGEINGTVKSIGGTVDSILGAVLEINGSATSINGFVQSIGAKVRSVDGKANNINRSANEINGKVRNIRSTVDSIDGTARSILGRLSSVLSTAQKIDPKVETIIGQAQGIKAVTAPILTDFDGILRNVGTQNGTNTVLGHANGIDCSTPINGTECNK
ncbi:MAG: hypothetical protein ACR2LK_10990 [Solirubrobacteraceae bacterium]